MLATLVVCLCSFYLPPSDPVPLIAPAVRHESKMDALPFVLPQDYEGIVLRYSYESDVPVWIVCRMISTEDTGDPLSGAWDPDVVSPKGAVGLMQIMPENVPLYALWFNGGDAFDPRNPSDAIRIGLRVLADLHATTGSWPAALAAYNGGLYHWYNARRWPWAQESVDYVWKILRVRI